MFKMMGPSLIPQSRNEIMNEVKGRLNFFENNMYAINPRKDKEKRIKDLTNKVVEGKSKVKRISEECQYAMTQVN